MIQSYQGKSPDLAPTARAAENATLVGDLTLGQAVNIWFGAVLRGDVAPIRVGTGTNIQDNAVVHCDEAFPVSIGRDVTVGHGAILHGCHRHGRHSAQRVRHWGGQSGGRRSPGDPKHYGSPRQSGGGLPR